MHNAVLGVKIALHITLYTVHHLHCQKHGSGIIMPWVCFSPARTGNMVGVDMKMDGRNLDKNLLESAGDLRLGRFTCQKVNYPWNKLFKWLHWITTGVRMAKLKSRSNRESVERSVTDIHKRRPFNLTKLELFCKAEWVKNSVCKCAKLVKLYL